MQFNYLADGRAFVGWLSPCIIVSVGITCCVTNKMWMYLLIFGTDQHASDTNKL